MPRVALLLLLLGLGGCKEPAREPNALPPAVRKAGPEGCKDPPDGRIQRRFAMGSSPRHWVSALFGEARKCTTQFAAGPVVTLVLADGGAAEPVLTAEGLFWGTCDGQQTGPFESARVASVTFETTATYVGYEPFTLDSRQPERPIAITVYPRDRCGDRLDAGHGWNARWKLGPGCDQVLAPTHYEGQPETIGSGFDKPGDAVRLKPIAPGACDLEVDYFGASGSVKITVL